jgi:hypothetical protein
VRRNRDLNAATLRRQRLVNPVATMLESRGLGLSAQAYVIFDMPPMLERSITRVATVVPITGSPSPPQPAYSSSAVCRSGGSRGKPAARGIAGKASSSDARGWPAYAADDDASPHERHGGAYASPARGPYDGKYLVVDGAPAPNISVTRAFAPPGSTPLAAGCNVCEHLGPPTGGTS